MRCEQQNVKNVLERDYSLFWIHAAPLSSTGNDIQRNGKYLNGLEHSQIHACHDGFWQ